MEMMALLMTVTKVVQLYNYALDKEKQQLWERGHRLNQRLRRNVWTLPLLAGAITGKKAAAKSKG